MNVGIEFDLALGRSQTAR